MSTTLFLFILLTTFPHFCHAKKPLCLPSSCGVIRNISYPFRLKSDPNHHCGHRILTCQNNLTTISLKAITYHNSTIRLVDASLTNDDICSFPVFSDYYYNVLDDSSYYYQNPYFSTYPHGYYKAFPINLMSCPNPLNNSSLFTNITTTYCSSNGRYSYVKVGHMNASEVPHMCGLDLIAMTAWEFHDLNNVSFSEIHRSLLYGFELTFCGDCGPLSFFIQPAMWWGKNHRMSPHFNAIFAT